MRILRPIPRLVTRLLAALAGVAWLSTMGALVNRAYLQPSGSLATDLARYGSNAQWHGVYYRGEKIGFTVRQVLPAGRGFDPDNPSQVAGSFGGVAFMVAAVLFIGVMLGLLGWPSSMYLLEVLRGTAPSGSLVLFMRACFTAAAVVSLAIWWFSMRSGIKALGVR